MAFIFIVEGNVFRIGFSENEQDLQTLLQLNQNRNRSSPVEELLGQGRGNRRI
jgi:hypothetical protein